MDSDVPIKGLSVFFHAKSLFSDFVLALSITVLTFIHNQTKLNASKPLGVKQADQRAIHSMMNFILEKYMS